MGYADDNTDCGGYIAITALLPEDTAQWLERLVAAGVYPDTGAAVAELLRQAQELEPHDDLKEELFRRCMRDCASASGLAAGDGASLEELEDLLEEALDEEARENSGARYYDA